MREPYPRARNRVIAGAAAAAILFCAEGCSAQLSPKSPVAVTKTVDSTRHLGDCQEPCSVALYKQPKATRYLSEPQLNAQGNPSTDPSGTLGYVQLFTDELGHHGPWPSDGETLEVVCQLRGETIHDKNSNPRSPGRTSDVWDVVRVPLDKLNQLTLQEAPVWRRPSMSRETLQAKWSACMPWRPTSCSVMAVSTHRFQPVLPKPTHNAISLSIHNIDKT